MRYTEAVLHADILGLTLVTAAIEDRLGLVDLERHERDPDIPGVPSLLIVEASGSTIHHTSNALSQKMGVTYLLHLRQRSLTTLGLPSLRLDSDG
jgi:hypothetical protein